MRSAVKRYVSEAISAIEPSRYQQEPSYIAGLAGRLHGVAYNGKDARVVFESTVVADRGPGSAESWSGVDLAITASISDARSTIRKAILVQAKMGQVGDLAVADLTDLLEQIAQMKRPTRSPQVMEILEENGRRIPRMVSGNRLFDNEPYRGMDLEDYFVRRVLTTLDGDTRRHFVTGVQESRLTQLRVLAEVSRGK